MQIWSVRSFSLIMSIREYIYSSYFNKKLKHTIYYLANYISYSQIGLMRNGVLLAEQPPGFLMERYQCDSLEEVFLKLSEKQEGENEVK